MFIQEVKIPCQNRMIDGVFYKPENRKRFPIWEDIPDTQELWGMLLGRKFFESIHDFDIHERTGKFSKNVPILHGAEDTVVPFSYGEWAASRYPNARIEIFQGEGHGFSEYGVRRMEGMTLYFIHGRMRQNRS